MNMVLKRLVLGIASASALGLYGCGGGGGSATGGGGGDVVATVDVPITVVDGPIQNAKVCLDKNDNGVCDPGEPAGSTDSEGKVTLKVDSTDAGKYPVIAVVGTDAIDADTGAVPTPFTMKAPADQPAVITPLTTLVQNVVASTGSTSTAAADVVKAQTGINVNLFEDFSKGTSDDHKAAANIARMVVVTTQQQSEAVKTAEGTKDVSGSTITKEDLDKAIQKKVMEMLPALVIKLAESQSQVAELEKALADAKALIDANARKAAVEAAQKAKDDALKAKMTEVVVTEKSGLTADGIGTVVAVNKQQESKTPVVAETPSAGFNLRALSFTDVSNYFVRFFSGTALQNTPDSKGNVRYVDNRYKAVDGLVAAWNTGGNPARQADLHWNGTAWVACLLNFESVSSIRDAKGNSDYNYCDNRETGKSSLASFDVSGKKMADVMADVFKAGYTNLGATTDTQAKLIAALGNDTFPSKSSLGYSNGTALTTAIAYNPGSDNWVVQYSKAVSDGGISKDQPPNQQCRSPEFSGLPAGETGGPTYSTTLEGMVTSMTGTPCINDEASFSYGGVTYMSGTRNEAWGATSVSLGTIGTAPVNSGVAPGFYTTNTKLRAAFKGSGTNAVTYYACKERFNNGSTRNCDVIGTGTYSIQAVGDGARTLSFAGLPALASALDYTRVFVERGSKVYYGYQNRPMATNGARLNTVASTALLAKLGLPAVSVDQPLALTTASYQGTWDAYPDSNPSVIGLTLKISSKGGLTCSALADDRLTVTPEICSLTSFNPATGQFVFTNTWTGSSPGSSTVSGTLSFINGTGNASYVAPDGSGTAKFVRR
jgi:trimeric autotransporter adhesin